MQISPRLRGDFDSLICFSLKRQHWTQYRFLSHTQCGQCVYIWLPYTEIRSAYAHLYTAWNCIAQAHTRTSIQQPGLSYFFFCGMWNKPSYRPQQYLKEGQNISLSPSFHLHLWFTLEYLNKNWMPCHKFWSSDDESNKWNLVQMSQTGWTKMVKSVNISI